MNFGWIPGVVAIVCAAALVGIILWGIAKSIDAIMRM